MSHVVQAFVPGVTAGSVGGSSGSNTFPVRVVGDPGLHVVSTAHCQPVAPSQVGTLPFASPRQMQFGEPSSRTMPPTVAARTTAASRAGVAVAHSGATTGPAVRRAGANARQFLSAEPRLHSREASLVIGDAVAKLPVFAKQVAHLVYGADDGGELGRQSVLHALEPNVRCVEPHVRCVEARVGAAQLVTNALQDFDGHVGGFHARPLLLKYEAVGKQRPGRSKDHGILRVGREGRGLFAASGSGLSGSNSTGALSAGCVATMLEYPAGGRRSSRRSWLRAAQRQRRPPRPPRQVPTTTTGPRGHSGAR